jgi:uncharacterized damage-inducible protein DinB
MLNQDLGVYQQWAGEKMRSVLMTLNSDQFRKDVNGRSVRSVAEHIVLALETCFYLSEKDFDKSIFDRIKMMSNSELLDEWTRLDVKLKDALQSQLKKAVNVPHVSDNPYKLDIHNFLVQYVLHTTHHRGQLALLLRSLGVDVPGTDYLMFFGEFKGK